MKSFYARSLWALMGLIGLAQPAFCAEPFGSASLLPMPSTYEPAVSYPTTVAPASYGGYQEQIAPGTQAPEPTFAPPPPVVQAPDYQGAMKQSWDGAGSCGPSIAAATAPCCPRVFGYAGGLVLGRAGQCGHVLTQQAGVYDTILDSSGTNQQWSGGFEVGGGIILPNCCNAIGVTYWGLFPSNQGDWINAADYGGNLIRPALGPNLDQVYYDNGAGTNQSVYNWMSTNTGKHEVWQNYNYNSVEANFFGNTLAWGLVPYNCGANCNGCNGCGCNRLQFGWLGGLRYFNYGNGFALYSDQNDQNVWDANDPDQLCYHINTNNVLLGVQMGGQASYYLTNCLSLYGAGRFGVYNNHITASQWIDGSNGMAVINSGNYAGTTYNFNSSRDVLATLGQLDFGARYQLGCHWSFYSGYRIVGISNVANATGQISQNFADGNWGHHICAGDAVVLHGIFTGAQFAW
jgi:hypothetical protein